MLSVDSASAWWWKHWI